MDIRKAKRCLKQTPTYDRMSRDVCPRCGGDSINLRGLMVHEARYPTNVFPIGKICTYCKSTWFLNTKAVSFEYNGEEYYIED